MKLSILLMVVGAAFEFAHSRVKSGGAAGDPNVVASIEGTLANLSEITGASLRAGLILFAVGAYLMVRGK